MKNLYFSFTGMYKYLVRGEIDLTKLGADDLFAFGCQRAHLIQNKLVLPDRSLWNDWDKTTTDNSVFTEWLWYGHKNPDQTTIWCRQLRTALLRSEAEGRCVWFPHDQRDIQWLLLYEMLRNNGIDCVEMLAKHTGGSDLYLGALEKALVGYPVKIWD